MLRGTAALAVFVYHTILELNVGGDGWLGQVSGNPYSYFFPHHLGELGVKLFFVLSGFCIHASTERRHHAAQPPTGAAQWRDYARRRALRILPPYALVLFVLFLLTPSSSPLASLAELGLHGAFLQTLAPGHINHYNPSFWSLAVEVQLYALYPLLALAMRRWSPAVALTLAAALSLGWALVIPTWTHNSWVTHLPWRWGFEWFLGVAVAQWLTSRSWVSGRVLAASLLLSLAVLLPSRAPVLYAMLPPLVFAALVGWAARRQPLSLLEPLARLGRVSYAFYLVHQPLVLWCGEAARHGGWKTVDPIPYALVSALSFGLALAAATILERLMRQLVRR